MSVDPVVKPWLAGLSLVVVIVASSALTRHVPPAPGGTVVFREDFDTENGFAAEASYTAFRQWDVLDGDVDLVGTYPFALVPQRQGMAVDLDGTTDDAATLRTKEALSLAPGRYRLTFRFTGMPRVSDPNRVTVSVGRWMTADVVVRHYSLAREHALEFPVAAPDTGRISFANHGGDSFGALLDDVVLARL